MRKNRRSMIVAAAGLAVSASAQAQYAIVDNQPGAFLDISQTGTAIQGAGDDTVHQITTSIGNQLFPAGTVTICSNGWMCAGVATAAPYYNDGGTLPTTGLPTWSYFPPGTQVCPLPGLDDRDGVPAPNPTIYWQQVGGMLVVQWHNISHYFDASGTNTIDFEVKVFGTPSGGVYAQYIYSDAEFGAGYPGYDNGVSATVGGLADSNAGSNNFQYSYDTAVITDNLVLTIVGLPTGACCMPNGGCEQHDSVNCASLGGTYHGNGSPCAGANCPGGACCLPNLTCVSATSASCSTQSGTYLGEGTSCGTSTCPYGACCVNDGTCNIQIPGACTGAGGIYRGDGSVCATANCPLPQGVWIEVGDAGDFMETANVTRGNGALNTIRGTLAASDADMYAIRICDPANFSAQTVGGATFDSQLFLFTAAGMGVESDDDDPYGSGTLQSHITSLYTSSLPAGVFFLAVSQYNKDPWDSSQQYIWANQPFNVERAPDGPGAANPIASWDTGGGTGGTYAIAMTGACYAQAAPTCYANCDSSTTIPCLNVLDFTCFLNSFAAGASYANCDASTTIPVLNVLDFTCFLNRFAAGCSSC